MANIRQETYIELRATLDALEISALRYCLSAEDNAALQARFNEIHPALRSLGAAIRSKLKGGELVALPLINPNAVVAEKAECPEGMHYCKATGECLPYPCPH